MISKFDEMNRTMYKFIKKKPIKAPMQLNQMKITPGNRDYENGYIVRYFARQTNSIQSPIIEIDLKTYKKVAKQEDGFYKLITIDWRITGDRENKIIRVGYCIFSKLGNSPIHDMTLEIKGKTAIEIVNTLIRENLISSLQHAADMGIELTKAELALKYNLEYIQDKDLIIKQ